MKSITKLILILFLCSNSFTNSYKTKKTNSMFEFFNGMTNTNTKNNNNNNNSEINNLKAKFKKNKKSHSHKIRKSNKKKNSLLDDLQNSLNSNSNKRNNKVDNTEINFLSKKFEMQKNFKYTGWQQIASKLFKNDNLFPILKVPDQLGRIVEQGVKIDKDNFRINYKKNAAPRNDKEFYFRMDEEMISYTTDDKDVNYLQILYLKDYNKVEEMPIKIHEDKTSTSCFDIIEKLTKFRYSLCSKDRKENLKLMCIIGKKFYQILDSCIKDDPEETEFAKQKTVVKETVEDATIIIPLPSKECNEKWNYDNHGDDWECLCKVGGSQSPIDLPHKDRAIYSPVVPIFNFEEIPAKVPVTTVEGEYIEDGNIKIKYLNGAIRVLHPNLGKVVTLNGSVYIGEEISVHTPSEHTKEGKRYDMEIQFTFYGTSKGDIANQVVLSFLFEKKPGYYNRFIDDLDFYTLPNPNEPEKYILNNLYIPKIFYSVTGGESDESEFTIMKPFSFFTYEGSLTQPPCSENTIHYVAAEVLPIGGVVLDLAMEALRQPDMKKQDSNGSSTIVRDDSTIENYRNLQDLNHRNVFYFDHKKCMQADLDVSTGDNQQIGTHYEKIKKEVAYHIFVPGEKPSGIPGSFLESKDDALGIKKDENKK